MNNINTYQPRPVAEVTTEDLIATIARDRNSFCTFEARSAFVTRTQSSWRDYAPVKPRTFVDVDGCKVYWHNFVETGML